MLKKILLAVAVVLAALVVFVATGPDSFEVSRTHTVAAPSAAVFSQVVDFHKWEGWSPWETLDPAMKRSFDGTPGAVGSTYAWSGNKDVGRGKMTVLEVKPGELVRIELAFIEPFASTSVTTFTFQPEGAGTRVHWAMRGENDLVGKAFCRFMDMDAMVGKDFDKGLARLDTAARAEAARVSAAAPKE